MPLAAWRENSSRHVASLRRIRLLFFIAPVSSTITGRDYPQWTDLRKYVAELPVTITARPDDASGLRLAFLSMIVSASLQALARNKLRSTLTMLGVFIGVAALIAMVAVGD